MNPLMQSPLGSGSPKDWVLLKGSDEFFPALVRCIDAAKQEVRLETYICDFSLGALGVAQALERAAARGVHVMVMLDGKTRRPKALPAAVIAELETMR